MKLRLSIIFLILVQTYRFQTTTAASITGTSSKSTNASDEVALLSFKSQVDDPFGAFASWNASLPFCQWPGVTCGGRHHPDRVSALDLESLGLTGPISPSLANLTFLKRLHLPCNNFQRYIPEELGRLYRLQHLNLSSNSLQGGIPNTLLNISTLRNISFQNNRLQGELPRYFPPLTNLTNLDLSDNMFVGAIPPSLGNISALAFVDISNNSLTGNIPSSMGMLSSLTVFDLSMNNFTGDIPPSIFNLSLLASFNVHTNNLSGTLPADLGTTLPYLKKLYLFENLFSGPIPISISNASGLEGIELYSNEFSGTIPSTLGTLRNLSSLILGSNQLEAKDAQDWRFFTGLVNCTNLQILDVGNNVLGGFLPDAITNLSQGLTWLSVMQNQISGSIPPEISNLISLSVLQMCQNLFTEYGIMNKVSTKGDVYSYGILVLEMFTGKKPTDHAFTEEDTNLHKFVATAFPGRVMDIVDTDIFLDEDAGGDDNDDDDTRRSTFTRRRENVHELLASVLRVGLSCSKELQSGRMQMGDVVKELVAAKYAFVSDESHEENTFEITMEAKGASAL